MTKAMGMMGRPSPRGELPDEDPCPDEHERRRLRDHARRVGRPLTADPAFVSGSSHGIGAFLESCEAALMGRTTFEPALANDRWPWPDLIPRGARHPRAGRPAPVLRGRDATDSVGQRRRRLETRAPAGPARRFGGDRYACDDRRLPCEPTGVSARTVRWNRGQVGHPGFARCRAGAGPRPGRRAEGRPRGDHRQLHGCQRRRRARPRGIDQSPSNGPRSSPGSRRRSPVWPRWSVLWNGWTPVATPSASAAGARSRLNVWWRDPRPPSASTVRQHDRAHPVACRTEAGAASVLAPE